MRISTRFALSKSHAYISLNVYAWTPKSESLVRKSTSNPYHRRRNREKYIYENVVHNWLCQNFCCCCGWVDDETELTDDTYGASEVEKGRNNCLNSHFRGKRIFEILPIGRVHWTIRWHDIWCMFQKQRRGVVASLANKLRVEVSQISWNARARNSPSSTLH